MDHPVQPDKENMQESASAYYYKNRKRSFLFTRITVVSSMVILVIALGANIYALSSQNQGTGKSEAATQDNPIKNLPKIPQGCSYKQLQGGLTVVCPTAVPTVSANPITIVLPQFPPQCSLETSTSGSAVTCTSSNVTIPDAAVTLPKTCTVANKPDMVSCRINGNQEGNIPLPSLPRGCVYTVVAHTYYVACRAQ